ncbi:DUF6602 domain-containing protein [Spirochaetota bacterium]
MKKKGRETGFKDFAEIEMNMLTSKLKTMSKVMPFSSVKGKVLEDDVLQLLRSFLPNEYGLGSGFIAYIDNNKVKISDQLDIIIYDALRGGPMVSLDSCNIFPIESVYGYVEVKDVLNSSSKENPSPSSIQYCIKQSNDLRKIRKRIFWGLVEDKKRIAKYFETKFPSIRTFVFAFDSKNLGVYDRIREKMFEETKKIGGDAHLSGMFIGGKGYFQTHFLEEGEDKNNLHIESTNENSLLRFKWSMLHSLSRFPRYPKSWTPAVDKYFEFEKSFDTFPVFEDNAISAASATSSIQVDF